MATFTVMNLNDAGAGSLRDALVLANANPDADTIDFQAGLTGTILLTTGELTISNSVTIEGGTPGLITISGNDASRVFSVTGGTSKLHALTITHGGANNGGGGIAVVSGDLTIADATLSANTSVIGGAIFNGGTLTLTNSIVEHNDVSFSGGGIFNGNGSTLTLSNTVVSGNTAQILGGGIYNMFAGTVSAVD